MAEQEPRLESHPKPLLKLNCATVSMGHSATEIHWEYKARHACLLKHF